MKRFKTFENFNVSKREELPNDILHNFEKLSKYLGIEEHWLIDYLIECFSYNLDTQQDIPFDLESVEDKLDNIRHSIYKIPENKKL